MKTRAQYVLAGTRQTLHRLPTRESCNVDQAIRKSGIPTLGHARQRGYRRLCRHCFSRRGR